MKKIFLLLIFTLFLSSCASYNDTFEENGKLNICATIFPQYDFAREIAGDFANIKMLLPAGTEIHTYEPSPQDIIKIQSSDLFIYTGGASDAWVDEILKTIDTSKMTLIKLVDVCNTKDQEKNHDLHEHSNEHTHDEHVWTSPKNAIIICDELLDALCSIDSKNAQNYKKNHVEYISKLLELDNEFTSIVNGAKRKTVVFADRFPFKNLFEDYGLEYVAAFSGCSEDTQASISTITSLIDKVKADNIPVVFYLEFSNHSLADTISKETGAEAKMLHSCHNITAKELESGITYIDLMSKNAKTLMEALN